MIPNKFEMSRKDSIFVAKKYLKESVYRSAFLEGIAVTFPQTEEILDGAAVADVSTKDISKVFGLRDGWQYILEHLDDAIDLKFLEDLHQLVAREDVPWEALGRLRTQGVRITGTNYTPPLPDAERIHRELGKIMDGDGADTDRAITAMLYIMRAQPFLDGNKRIGTLVANKILVSTGRGIFSLPPELKVEFSTELVRFYETGETNKIKRLISENCLTGLE